jgi:hypothetical protein
VRTTGFGVVVTALVALSAACAAGKTTESRPATATVSASGTATYTGATATPAAALRTATAEARVAGTPGATSTASSSVELGGHFLPNGPIQFAGGSLKFSQEGAVMEVTVANSDRVSHSFNAQADISDGSGTLLSTGTLAVALPAGGQQTIDIPVKSFTPPRDGRVQVSFRATGR